MTKTLLQGCSGVSHAEGNHSLSTYTSFSSFESNNFTFDNCCLIHRKLLHMLHCKVLHCITFSLLTDTNNAITVLGQIQEIQGVTDLAILVVQWWVSLQIQSKTMTPNC